jgi:multidrug efflux pump subunit AcrB
LVDGEVITGFQDQGEEVKVRVIAESGNWYDVDDLLRQTISLAGGRSIMLGELVSAEYGYGQYNIRHYNFRRTVTLEADIDETRIDTVRANEMIMAEWDRIQSQFPTIDLDFTGQLDDIQESLDALWILFLFGIGCIYLILGTQFRSYWQPFMILMAVPLAFTGVILGLLISGNPLSLYTLYGVVALAGISVNSAIVLIAAANQRIEQGMSLAHSARRRVIPILITSSTTIGGLFSLAVGIGGKSLIWGPVATAIVWGLAFSTVLTLIVIPFLYRFFMTQSVKNRISPAV